MRYRRVPHCRHGANRLPVTSGNVITDALSAVRFYQALALADCAFDENDWNHWRSQERVLEFYDIKA